MKVGMWKCSGITRRNVCLILSDLVQKVEREARQSWISQDVINKMEERWKLKNVNNK